MKNRFIKTIVHTVLSQSKTMRTKPEDEVFNATLYFSGFLKIILIHYLCPLLYALLISLIS
jgi:hypothetical protein